MLALAGLQALAIIALAACVAVIVDSAVTGPESAAPAWWLGAGLAVLARFGLHGGRDALARALAMDEAMALRTMLRERVARLGPIATPARAPTAVWASQYQAGVDAVGAWFARYLPARDAALVMPAVIVAAVAWVDWVAGLLLLASAPLIPAFMVLVGLGSRRLQARHQHQQHRMAAHFLDRVRALDLLRRSGALESSTRAVEAAADRYRVLGMRVLRVAFLSSAVLEFFAAVAIGVIAIYVGFGLLGAIDWGPAPALGLGSGLFVLLLAPEFFLPLRQLGLAWHDRAGALAAERLLAPLLEEARMPAAGPAAASGDALLRLDGADIVPAEGVHAVVRDVSLALRPGELVWLAGPSGSGKTSLLASCAGWLAPVAGTVHRPGHRVWLGQRGHLFHGTVRDNLLLADPCADDGRLAHALAEAGLAVDDPALPLGLDTPVGEGRRGLSGGQAQRVALARAWLSDARLWLLDEPTRGLDAETAEAFWRRVRRLCRDRGLGVLVASHEAPPQGCVDRRWRIVAGGVVEDSHAPA